MFSPGEADKVQREQAKISGIREGKRKSERANAMDCEVRGRGTISRIPGSPFAMFQTHRWHKIKKLRDIKTIYATEINTLMKYLAAEFQ